MYTQTIPISPFNGSNALLTLSIQVNEAMVLPDKSSGGAIDPGFMITPAELKILKEVGLTDEEIARKLFLSKNTVSTHFKNMLTKTGFRNRSKLVYWATKAGLI